MTFPATPLGMTVELLIDGTWTDLTSLVYGRDQLKVTRGRGNEATKVDRSTCRFTANNRSGNLSPRNPVGTYYGKIGRNTRMRVRLAPAPAAYVLVPTISSAVTAPDSAGLSITGDLDVRIDVSSAWVRTGTDGLGLAGKYETTGDQRSWALWLDNAGTLTLAWSPDGTLASRILATSTIAVAVPADGRLAVRATLDVDNGAGGNDVKLYTATSLAGPWTQLGATVTTSGTTSISDSTAPLVAGGISDITGVTAAPTGRLYGLEVYSGIGGTLKGDITPSDGEPGDATITDSEANVWTLSGSAALVDPAIRFQGEISEWPQRWDTTGRDVHVPLEASGVLRRLTQGSTPLHSVLYRAITRATLQPKAYWPCEDGTDAAEIGSAIGGPSMRILGTPSLASHTGFKCSEALPLLSGSRWDGRVGAYTAPSPAVIAVTFLLQIPSGGSVANKSVLDLHSTGTIALWRINYQAGGGDFTIRAFNGDGTSVLDQTFDFNIDGQLIRVALVCKQNGTAVDWWLNALKVGSGTPGGGSGTISGQTVSKASKIAVNWDTGSHDQVAVGHIAVYSADVDLATLTDELNAYSGEAAGRRVERLCAEEAVAVRVVGDPDATAAMGAQLPATLVDLLDEAATADGGILGEPRDLFGLGYRTRESLYDQAAGLALDYAAAHLSGIEPTDDDQLVRNDVTVHRTGGSSSRVTQSSGPLSTAAPPSGVGRYDDDVTLNLEADSQLDDAAGWLLWLGTVDEARYPVLQVDLARASFVADQALALAALDLDVGDRLTIANPPAWLPPDLVTQLAQGFAETMGNFTHQVAVNCSPESPWGAAARYNDGVARYSSDGSTLGGSLTTTATSMSVATASGPLWSHADGDFTIRVGGETMTVTAVSGSTSPQTFTVTRSVNGVVKTHAAGETVALDHPVVYVR